MKNRSHEIQLLVGSIEAELKTISVYFRLQLYYMMQFELCLTRSIRFQLFAWNV